MKRFWWILGCAVLLVTAAHAPARAQIGGTSGDSELGRGWDLRAGFFIPEREPPRRAEGDLWFTIGAERSIYQVDRWNGTISVDYYGSGRTYNIPITLNARGDTKRFRYGAGAGIGISHDLQEGKTGFAYNLLVGYTLRTGANPVMADIRYMGLSTGGGMLNGWAFTLGVHF